MGYAPVAPQLPRAEWQRHKRTALELRARDPRREHSGAESDFHQFFNGLHAAELDEIGEQDFFLAEIFTDEPERVAGLVIKHELLVRNRLAHHATRAGPGMQRRDHETQ